MLHRTPNRRRACTTGAIVAVVTLGTLLGATSPAAAAEEATAAASGIPGASGVTGVGPETDQQPDQQVTGSGDTGPTTDAGPAATGSTGSGPAGSATASATTDAGSGTGSGSGADSGSGSSSGTSSATADTAVTIDGTAAVGATLTARPTGFTGPVTSTWSADGTARSADGDTYVPTRADAGKVITVTVSSTTDPSRSASTDRVTAPPAFADATTPDDPIALTTGAGEAFSHTFAATGFPAPTYSVQYWDEHATPEESEGGESSFLPYGLTLDHATGVLSGTSDYAGTYAFRIVATDGTTSVSQYVTVTTTPAAPLGVEVTAEDRGTFLTAHSTSWVIERDGTVWTFQNETTHESDGGYTTIGSGFEGGRPTIDQGGTLLVGGNLVDRFGNAVDADRWPPTPTTVTSDHASDVIAPDDEWTDMTDVTFPQASTHRISVAAEGFSTAFLVDVRPTATTTTVRTVATPTRHELAYTGSDAKTLLPWAAGLLLGGVAITAVRGGLRRRR
ncbi:putative Ig domain-containing protein [Curtobacterium sp. NPDC089689]|uniref:putative Ig domain-containing protein n=1 Tax=Curtobacterium sp. NPDC089689 TaxID=3363968 RepID=UPI0038239C04